MIDIGLILIGLVNLMWYKLMSIPKLPLWTWAWFPIVMSIIAGILFTVAREANIVTICGAIFVTIAVVFMFILTLLYRLGQTEIVRTPIFGVVPIAMTATTIYLLALGLI